MSSNTQRLCSQKSCVSYAARRGTSVSRLVEKLLSLVVRSSAKDDVDLPPVLARLRAELKDSKAGPADYRRYLERKYR